MTQVASGSGILAPFDDVTLALHGRKYQLSRRNGEYWVNMDAEGTSPGTGRRVDRRIVMTTGSHHLQVYWFETGQGRRVAQLPFSYLIKEQRWIPDHASFIRPPWPEGTPMPVAGPARWEKGCIRCHATRGRPRLSVAGLPTVDTHVSEFGISCESCHGPGEAHAQINRNPQRRYEMHFGDGSDDTVSQPQNMSKELSSQVCGQCHSVHTERSVAAALDWQNEGSRFEPGCNLFEDRHVVRGYQDENHPTTQRVLREDPQFLSGQFWSDGMVRVAGREFSGMIESACYIKGEMSCLSCHMMHKPASDSRAMEDWRDDQLKPGMRGNAACAGCHAEYAANIESHTHHAADSTGSLCYNCHMPHTVYGLHKAIRSHLIDSPTVQSSLDTGRPNACNQCHLDKSLAWTASHLSKWYGQPSPALTVDEASVAASALWMLKGDAGQRALMAWSMGWPDAVAASGNWWLPPYLFQAMVDPYDAVRLVAYRSLRTLPGYEEVAYDFVAGHEQRRRSLGEASRIFERDRSSRLRNSDEAARVLFRATGEVDYQAFGGFLEQRDHRSMMLRE